MTIAQQGQLDDLFNTYLEKKAIYDIEVIDNYKWSVAPAYIGQKADSDASLLAKRATMNSALNAYNLLKQSIETADKSAFNAANPSVAQNIAIAQTNAMANIDIQKNASEAAKEAKLFAQKNTKYIIIAGIAIAVFVTIVIVWKKYFSK